MSSNTASLERKPMDPLSSTIHKAVQQVCTAFAKDSYKGQDLSLRKQFLLIDQRFHGKGNVASQVDLLIEGHGHYKLLQKREDIIKLEPPLKINGEVVLDPVLHHILKTAIYNNNLNAKILKQSALKKENAKLTGQSIYKFANKEIAGAKKFAALMPEAVKSGIVQGAVNGIYMYSSGMGMPDLLNFLLTRMYNWSLLYGPTGRNNNSVSEVQEDSSNDSNGIVDDKNKNDTELNSDLNAVPCDSLPPGFMLFWLRGNHPSNPQENHLDMFTLDDGSKSNDGGHKACREKEVEIKKEFKEFSTSQKKGKGKNEEKKEDGGASNKELALIEQNARKIEQVGRKLDNHEFSANPLKTNQLLSLKHKMLDYNLKMMEFYMKVNNNQEAKNLAD
eukprot:CAMPEP_0195306624 /NCGR_PEP_ID=MMETSP0707-20130614/37295_1 /TAXON_ID=33640 /ORGANISM="Asterionellopsis glacialis, Strain CCMP134" /LENGTH=389 /DNA_ID=CAMNT_0040370845 /DNA_START=45 /DNA_END=1215 /DNA_ORIENTATION=+